MPRATLTAQESTLLAAALLDYAKSNGLGGGEALVAAALTTMGELHAVALQYLNRLRAHKVEQLNAIPTQANTATAAINSDIAAIDSALTKV